MYEGVWETLAGDKEMILVSGPRQAGKTTLSHAIAGRFANHAYFNWDLVTDRKKLLRHPYGFSEMPRKDPSAPLVIFDEIHKNRKWKNYLKGVYDGFRGEYRFLVTGSGRLDLYRKGGDSLAGRYLLFHLWPFTLAELAQARSPSLADFLAGILEPGEDLGRRTEEVWHGLAEHSGFPEPYLKSRKDSYRRWSLAYHSRMIREDIRDLSGVSATGEMETLFSLLPERVGGPLSLPALSEDLQVSYNTVKSWLEILERFFLVFTISPWENRVARAIRKARKTYLFDYAQIEDPAARFENMVALELFRAVRMWNDLGQGRFALHFIRTKEKEEVDFLVVDHCRPRFLVEAKSRDDQVSLPLKRIQQQLDVPAVQLTNIGSDFRRVANAHRSILVVPAHRWLARLP